MAGSLVLKSCTTRDQNLRLGPEAGNAKKSARARYIRSSILHRTIKTAWWENLIDGNVLN